MKVLSCLLESLQPLSFTAFIIFFSTSVEFEKTIKIKQTIRSWGEASVGKAGVKNSSAFQHPRECPVSMLPVTTPIGELATPSSEQAGLAMHSWPVQHLHIRTYMCRYMHMHRTHKYIHSTYPDTCKQTHKQNSYPKPTQVLFSQLLHRAVERDGKLFISSLRTSATTVPFPCIFLGTARREVT